MVCKQSRLLKLNNMSLYSGAVRVTFLATPCLEGAFHSIQSSNLALHYRLYEGWLTVDPPCIACVNCVPRVYS